MCFLPEALREERIFLTVVSSFWGALYSIDKISLEVLDLLVVGNLVLILDVISLRMRDDDCYKFEKIEL